MDRARLLDHRAGLVRRIGQLRQPQATIARLAHARRLYVLVPDAAQPELGVSGTTTSLSVRGGAWTGDYRLLGFAQTTKVHGILYFDQVGAWYGIRDIAYLDETGALQENIGDHLAGARLFAVTEVMSPDGQFIAFVGKASDTRPDAFRHITAPPSAPPSDLPDLSKGTGARSWLDKSGIASYQKANPQRTSPRGVRLPRSHNSSVAMR